MFRTRDFLLFLVVVFALLLAIVSTVKVDSKTGWWSGIKFSDDSVTYEAVLPERIGLDREEKIKEMREKIAKTDINENLASAVTAETEDKEIEIKDQTEAEEGVFEIKKCSDYSESNVSWQPQGLKFEVVEGARIVFRDKALELTSSSSLDISEREVVLQLPLRVTPAGSDNCLNSSIIGIALDGSLITNDDYSAYKIFSGETLIGYALDGFPIYGSNDNAKTDQCGGMNVDGQYRYYLSSDRKGMIGCFSGTPVSL
jgi:hypothetical protein